MLTKVAIILVCLVVLFGFGSNRRGLFGTASRSKSRSESNSESGRKPSLLTPTNILLAAIAVLLVLTLITTWAKG